MLDKTLQALQRTILLAYKSPLQCAVLCITYAHCVSLNTPLFAKMSAQVVSSGWGRKLLPCYYTCLH